MLTGCDLFRLPASIDSHYARSGAIDQHVKADIFLRCVVRRFLQSRALLLHDIASVRQKADHETTHADLSLAIAFHGARTYASV